MGLFSPPLRSARVDDARARKARYDAEVKKIKDILKSHDTQHHVLPLSFYNHIKPPVEPPQKMQKTLEMVSGRKIPFTTALATRIRRKGLGSIPEENTSPATRDRKRRNCKLVKMGATIKLIC
ncbi:hypothetical protein AC1031_004560 [Aphanomyces cochlioides]|nr:hypothetical protein AC1031_004560 [Aphanomyces cochlioides]